MIKKIIVLTTLLLISGCENSTREISFVLPPELKGCKVFRLSNTDGESLTVARCPAAATTTTKYTSGKTQVENLEVEATAPDPRVIVVDGARFVEEVAK